MPESDSEKAVARSIEISPSIAGNSSLSRALTIRTRTGKRAGSVEPRNHSTNTRNEKKTRSPTKSPRKNLPNRTAQLYKTKLAPFLPLGRSGRPPMRKLALSSAKMTGRSPLVFAAAACRVRIFFCLAPAGRWRTNCCFVICVSDESSR
jgi:hypothetical protein